MAEILLIEALICTLQSCRRSKDGVSAKLSHVHVCSYGLEGHAAIGNHIVPMLVECGRVPDACRVFSRLIYPNENSWTSLISGHAHHDQPECAINLYQRMLHGSVYPSSYTLVALLKACARLKDVARGQYFHNIITEKGLERELPLYSSLVGMYAKCGSLLEAQKVFDELSIQDIVSWNALIAGYVEYGRCEQALRHFAQMQLSSISPNAFTFACALKACGRSGALPQGRRLHKEVERNGFELDIAVGNTLIGMYANCGSLSEAQEVFEKLPLRDVVSWTALIAGFAEYGPGQEAVKHFEQMHCEGVTPNDATLACVLKACGSILALDKGQHIHTDIVKKEKLWVDSSVGNSLLGMYAKCGAFLDAQHVFGMLLVQDAVAWTALMVGYADYGHDSHVFNCLEKMQSLDIIFDSFMFACILKACGSLQARSKGQRLHTEITQKGLESDMSVGNSLVVMYAKSSMLQEAQTIFNRLYVRDIISWTVIIAGYADCGSSHEALKCFEQMQLEGISPEPDTFLCLVRACICTGVVDKGREIHNEVIQSGFDIELPIGNTLVDMYVKWGLVSDAQEVFIKMSAQDVVSWTTLIAGYAEHGPFHEALECFRRMKLDGISPNAFTFASVLKACGNMGAIDKGEKLLLDMAKSGLETDTSIGSSIIEMYAKSEMMSKAQEVFDKSPARDLVLWTSLIAGYAEHGPFVKALASYHHMQLEGVCPDVVTIACALKASMCMKDLSKGQVIHTEIGLKGFEQDLPIANTLVGLYAQCGLLLDAQDIFDKLSVHNVISWTALIAGYVEHGFNQEAIHFFDLMQLKHVSPHAETLACILRACGHLGAIVKGQEIFADVIQKGLEKDASVANSLISMYSKCGFVSDAWAVLDKMSSRDVVAWSSMIKGYAVHHEGELALECFDTMQVEGVKPDAITFTSLLNACRHTNLISEGHEFFNLMKEEFDIRQSLEHHTCMIDLLARSGCLYEAEKFLKSQSSPSIKLWGALLSACKIYGKVELGLRCFEQIVQVNPHDAASYVLMADIYSGAGRSDDALTIEGRRNQAGVNKKPAIALIEVNNSIYEFVVGDTHSEEVSAVLSVLSSRIEGGGHVPGVDLVLKSSSR